jgi:hypothetical protein
MRKLLALLLLLLIGFILLNRSVFTCAIPLRA